MQCFHSLSYTSRWFLTKHDQRGWGGGGGRRKHWFLTPRKAWSRQAPPWGFFSPSLCLTHAVFISLIGSNRLSIEINRENIFQTLKHTLPLIYVLKINLGGQPAKNVNCSFRHKSMKSLRRVTASEVQRKCLS